MFLLVCCAIPDHKPKKSPWNCLKFNSHCDFLKKCFKVLRTELNFIPEYAVPSATVWITVYWDKVNLFALEKYLAFQSIWQPVLSHTSIRHLQQFTQTCITMLWVVHLLPAEEEAPVSMKKKRVALTGDTQLMALIQDFIIIVIETFLTGKMSCQTFALVLVN